MTPAPHLVPSGRWPQPSREVDFGTPFGAFGARPQPRAVSNHSVPAWFVVSNWSGPPNLPPAAESCYGYPHHGYPPHSIPSTPGMSDPFVTPCTDRVVIPEWLRGFDKYYQEPEQAGDGYRRGLPHWRYAGASYFLTFRLGDSLPAGVVQAGQRAADLWEKSLEAERLALGGQLSEATRQAYRDFRWKAWVKMESLLDGGEGACVMRDPMVRRIVREGLLHFEGQRCHLAAFVVMPNHVHVLCQPWEGWALENLVGSWKKHTTGKMNRLLGQSGALWQHETYDRIIRDGGHFRRVVRYISRNPARAGLQQGEAEVWINPALLRPEQTS